MWKDPIVEEIHSIRRQIAEECNYDLDRIIGRLREKEEKHKNRIVLPRKPVRDRITDQ